MAGEDLFVFAEQPANTHGRRGRLTNNDEVCETRQHRPREIGEIPWLHDLRRSEPRQPLVESAGGREQAPHQAGDRSRHQLLRYRKRLLGRLQRRDRRPRSEGFRGPRRNRPRHEGSRCHAPGPEQGRALAQGDPRRDRRQPHPLLGTDYVDLYQIHRWDHTVPIEETLEALHDVVKSGKARYIGASSMFAWEFSKALHLQRVNGWSRFVSMQDHYNLLSREEEREMLPLCADEKIGAIPWSPLARGRLTRDWDEATERSATDEFGKTLYGHESSDRVIVEAVASIAAARGVSRAQIALAWVSRNPVVSAPIVGVRKPEHLDDALASLDIVLTQDEVAQLETPYTPHPVAGF